MARTSVALRAVSAASSAVSLASVPELVKNTLAFGMPDSLAIFSARSALPGIRFRLGGGQAPLGNCRSDGAGPPGPVLAGIIGEEAAEEAGVAAALGVGAPEALAAEDLDRLVVIDPAQ